MQCFVPSTACIPTDLFVFFDSQKLMLRHQRLLSSVADDMSLVSEPTSDSPEQRLAPVLIKFKNGDSPFLPHFGLPLPLIGLTDVRLKAANSGGGVEPGVCPVPFAPVPSRNGEPQSFLCSRCQHPWRVSVSSSGEGTRVARQRPLDGDSACVGVGRANQRAARCKTGQRPVEWCI